MRFWDSSALVPLCIQQPASRVVDGLLSEDQSITVWWASPVECCSAFARLHRAGVLDAMGEADARQVLERLAEGWSEVRATDSLREQAQRVLRLHPLTDADALQLAAALEWAGAPSDRQFVTFDDRLAAAARREGFLVVAA